MAATKIIPYKFRVRPTGEKEKDSYWDIADLSQNSVQTQLTTPESPLPFSDANNFIDLVTEFGDEYESGYRDFKEERLSNVTLAPAPNWRRKSEWIEGHLYLGNSGVVRNILNLDNGERDERGLDLDKATERPICFLIYISSKHATEGYILLEKSPRYGVKGALQIALRQWLNKNYTEKIEH